MAIREIIESDLSGKKDAATISFGLKDTWYEIDLTPEEQEKLEHVMETYVESARRTLSKETARRRQVPDTTPEERDEIRAWARAEGYEFAERGRIPKKIMTAYNKAHNTENRD